MAHLGIHHRFCGVCGASRDPSDSFCRICGAPAPSQQMTQQQGPVTVNAMMGGQSGADPEDVSTGLSSHAIARPPQPVRVARGAADEFAGKISARELAGCWVGVVLGVFPWMASLEPIDEDAYARSFQCCIPILPLCGRQYRRAPGTNTFHWEGGDVNEDWENFASNRCASMAPGEPPSGGAFGMRIC